MNAKYLGLSLAALALAGTAYAAPGAGGADPLGDKSVTKAEFLAKHGEMFAQLDANKDGKIDAADRAAHMDQRFDDADTDRNGSLSRAEFAAAHAKMGPGAGEKRAERRREGGARAGHHGMGKGGGMGMHMIRMADTNKDGTVTRDEFMAGAAQHFDKMDANKDGTLTAAERKAARAQMRGQRGEKRGGHAGHQMGDMPPPPGE